MTGKGSATNPYVVHSTRGFLWLTNYSLSKIILNSKYLELACDVVLNDESFDKNGTPSGGDGIVYSWQPITSAGNLIFDGRGNSISGMFSDKNISNKKSEVFLFKSTLEYVCNLKITNLFLSVQFGAAAISYSINRIENCIVEGNMKAEGRASGFAMYGYDNVDNLKNYVDIVYEDDASFEYKSASWFAGIFTAFYGETISNCQNYGNISGTQSNAGIVAQLTSSVECQKILNCQNYGTITTTVYHSAGIVSAPYFAIIKDCSNYGNIYSKQAAGGIAGILYRRMIIEGCSNYGYVGIEEKHIVWGEIVGYVSPNISEFVLNIKNCRINSISGGCVVGACHYFDENRLGVINIENCVFDYADSIYSPSWIVSSIQKNYTISLNIKNVLVNLGSHDNEFSFCRSIYSPTDIDINIDGVMFYGDSINNTKKYLVSIMDIPDLKIKVKSFVINTESKKEFCGQDFSSLYCDWKSGKIGLKALSGKGFYQGVVTEQTLIEKGFKKIAI